MLTIILTRVPWVLYDQRMAKMLDIEMKSQ